MASSAVGTDGGYTGRASKVIQSLDQILPQIRVHCAFSVGSVTSTVGRIGMSPAHLGGG